MGVGRTTQNIFYHLKTKNFKYVWRLIKEFDKTTFGDSFGPMICKIRGHRPYQHPYFEPNEYACKTCNRYVNMPTNKEIDESLYKNEIEAYALSPIRRFIKRLFR